MDGPLRLPIRSVPAAFGSSAKYKLYFEAFWLVSREANGSKSERHLVCAPDEKMALHCVGKGNGGSGLSVERLAVPDHYEKLSKGITATHFMVPLNGEKYVGAPRVDGLPFELFKYIVDDSPGQNGPFAVRPDPLDHIPCPFELDLD